MTAISSTSRYEIFRNSAIRNAAAPRTGGESHRRRDARAGRPAEQERGEDDGAAGAGRLAAHGREREVEIELAGARVLQERTVDGEQDDERRGDVDGDS